MHSSRIAPALVAILLAADTTSAEPIYESGSLGETGVPWLGAAGTGVDPDVFVGARFKVDQRALATRIGGHFVGHPFNPSDDFFGALIQLENDSDFPDSEDLTSADVMGTTILTFPETSEEAYGELSTMLDPGWYAVVFGSGLLGTSAVGATLRNGLDNGPQAYIGWQPGVGWFELSALFPPLFTNHRFVVEGRVIPEPSSASLSCFALALLSRNICARRSTHVGGSAILVRVYPRSPSTR